MQNVFSSESESWSFTIIRSQGLGPLRPEKGWRPIVTVVFDQQHHEIVLGSDGQNPNQKRPFYLAHANPKSHVEIDVWHKSQSKKKARKKNQVASVRLSLGELLKRQGSEPKTEIGLTCASASRRGQNIRGKQQNAACLLVRLRPPASYASTSETSTLLDMDEGELTDLCSSSDTDDTLTSPPTPRESEFDLPDLPPEQSKLKRRRVRGFSLDPNQEDGDECSIGSDDFPPIEAHACIDDFDEQGCIDDIDVVQPVSVRGWLAASILPRFSDQASANSTLSVAESTLSQFSYYRQLRDGSLDEDYERVLKALFSEWIWAGGFLLALAGVDATLFNNISSSSSSGTESAFTTNNLANQTIAVSGIFTAIGLFFDATYLLYHGTSTPERFRIKAMDVSGSYLSFSITSRLPAFCSCMAGFSLVLFIILTAFTVTPTAAIFLCGFAGLAITMQYLWYGFHTLGCLFMKVWRGTRNAIVWTFGAKSDSPMASGIEKASIVDVSADTIARTADMSIPRHLTTPSSHTTIATTVTSRPPPRPPRNPARNAARTRPACT